ncbi:MAG: NADH:ubiquinone reductase (Na(+)-transporting) subunit B [Pseudomonadota bacterium]
MKFLRDLFDNNQEKFMPGGTLERFGAIFRATRTFFFFPSGRTSAAPHVRDCLDLKRFMGIVILALMPVTLFGIYNAGYQSLLASGQPPGFSGSLALGARLVVPIILVSYGVGFFWEILFASIRKKEITEGLLVTGLLFPLTLPPAIPLWQVAAGMSFGIVLGKEVFGGTGRNILNPALTARAFVFFSYPMSMSGTSVWVANPMGVDAVSQATPLALSAATGSINDLLVHSGFTLGHLFLGLHPGSIGETSTLLCLLGAAILIITGVGSFRIICGGIMGLILTAALFNLLPGPQGTWFSASPLNHLCAGGFALGICFMATDPVSAPGTDAGRWIYGFLIGCLTVLIRAVNPAYVEGVMLAILFMNLFSPLLDVVCVKLATRKRIPNV